MTKSGAIVPRRTVFGLRWCAFLSLVSAGGCGPLGIDRSPLEGSPIGPDVDLSRPDVGAADAARPLDVGGEPSRRGDAEDGGLGEQRSDAPDVAMGLDGAEASDGTIDGTLEDLATAPGDDSPEVDAAMDASSCPRCPSGAVPEFGPGGDAGACVAVVACEHGCAVLVAPTRAGDRCEDAPTLARRGRSRLVMTTCRMGDDLTVGCDRSGPDVAFRVRVPLPGGRLVVRATTPPGTAVYLGFDRLPLCLEAQPLRTCVPVGAAPNAARHEVGFATPGIYNFFLSTGAPATVVIDAEIP